jgi:AcrR family transcriptional regulator
MRFTDQPDYPAPTSPPSAPAALPSLDTKERILETAERLFSERGFDRTSLRNITAAARVNLAAVHYYFGSKEGLLEAIFARVVGPVNEERLHRLDALEAGEQPPAVEDLLEAFLEPPLRLHQENPHRHFIARQLLGRMYSGTSEQVKALMLAQFGEIVRRFVAAFRRALPELPLEELMWRLHFMVGAMAHTMAACDQLKAFSGGVCQDPTAGQTLARLVPFIAAGLRIEASGTEQHNTV